METAIRQYSPNNDGILAKQLVQWLPGVSIRELNRCLYTHSERFERCDKQSLPPAWRLCDSSGESDYDHGSSSAVLDQLILIDLGNVHDCFSLFTENNSGMLVAAFADPAYNIEKILPVRHEKTVKKCYTKYTAGCKELYKSKLAHSNSADLLLIDLFYTLLNVRQSVGSETSVIIASKDKLLSTFAELIRDYVREVYVVSDVTEMKEVI